MIQLAMPSSELQKRLQQAQMGSRPTAQPIMDSAPAAPNMAERAGDMFVDRAIDKGMEQVGKEGLKKGLATAGAAAGGPMGAVAGEVAGEFAAPFLKDMLYSLFNKGGHVNGPLSPQYHERGNEVKGDPYLTEYIGTPWDERKSATKEDMPPIPSERPIGRDVEFPGLWQYMKDVNRNMNIHNEIANQKGTDSVSDTVQRGMNRLTSPLGWVVDKYMRREPEWLPWGETSFKGMFGPVGELNPDMQRALKEMNISYKNTGGPISENREIKLKYDTVGNPISTNLAAEDMTRPSAMIGGPLSRGN